MIDQYIKKIATVTKRGDAREESYYSALEALVEEFSQIKRNKKVHVTTLPKKTEAGNPDFRVWDGKHSQVGYIEAKSPQFNLDDVEKTEQLQRYFSTFPNLILTNFYEFRHYRDGKFASKVLLAEPYLPKKHKNIPPAENVTDFAGLLERFLQYSLPTTFTAESLAKELATRTRFLRDQVIKEELRETRTPGSKKILGFYEAFQKHLIANLNQDDFADMYAQTITYGLFAARTRANGKFNRKIAYDLIPKTIGILREIFHFISFDPPEQMEATVDDIAEVLHAADVRKILTQYFDERKGSDPIYHFYETFLAEYNPQLREQRGVYYTPEPVVSYIVQSLNIILKEKFGRQDGLATPSVTVLDPAGGTLTFLAEAAKLAVEEYVSKYGKASRGKFVEEHILKHFFAFELMMAPYAAGHLKMGYLLEELGHKLSGDERLKFYLTNTLEMEELTQTTLPVVRSLSQESQLASQIKKQEPILVILGNPPYSGISANPSEYIRAFKKGERYVKSYTINTNKEDRKTSYQLIRQTIMAKKDMKKKQKTWIGEQIENYKIIDGAWFGERKHWLQDDYVKFIRFAQWKIDQIGEGVIGFITNHGYLDNPTFGGMRQSLLNSFDEIYILDLHGNLKKKEKCPDGSQDDNVFDIMQGVAIVLMIKNKLSSKTCSVYRSDLWGLRGAKYEFLASHTFKNTQSVPVYPTTPSYSFGITNKENKSKWDSLLPLRTGMPIGSTAVQTSRDDLVVGFNKLELEKRIEMFGDMSYSDDKIAALFSPKDTRGWKWREARVKVASYQNWREFLVPVLYRPFDFRYELYTDLMVDWPRREIMENMLQDNIALCIGRAGQVTGAKEGWSLTFCARAIQDHNLFYRGGHICSPLYLYPSEKKHHDLFTKDDLKTKKTNFAKGLLIALEQSYGLVPSPEDIFSFIYAILYSNAYRDKYAEFLRSEFPRVPFTRDFKLFKSLAEKGTHLIDLHLLKSKKLDIPIAKCEGADNLQVEKINYDVKKNQVQFNRDNWFSNVPENVWYYHVGGYQVAEKWLKDRKGRALSSEEVAAYAKVITALAETIRIQESVDELFEEVESSLLEIKL